MLTLGLHMGVGSPRLRSSGFNLANVSSLLHWYTFNTGQTLNTGLTPNRISAWADQKGSNNLTQSTQNLQPTITNGILDFTSSAAQLVNDSDISLTNFTIILVVKTDFNVDTILGNLDVNGVLLRLGHTNEDDKVRLQFDVTDGGHGINSFDLEADSDFPIDTKFVFSIARNASANTVKMFANTTQKFSGNLVSTAGNNAGNSPLVIDKIGSHGVQQNAYSDEISEYIIFNQDLTQNMSEFTDVINDVKSRNSIS
tara:strand:+ start:101 stop:865 length:765 start_codon:yes stop_codon:yes gene_type:complete